MTSEVEKADEAPVPLPPSAWRVTPDLQFAIERCLTQAGQQILGRRFSDPDCRHWQLELLFGQTVEVSVDCAVSPGTVRIAVCGAGSERIQTLLNRYQKIPILKISITLTANELICRVPPPIRRQMPFSLAERVKFAARYSISIAGYKIVREPFADPSGCWVVCLNTAQQLKFEGFDTCSESELTITGFGTDLNRLQQLMSVFDVSD